MVKSKSKKKYVKKGSKGTCKKIQKINYFKIATFSFSEKNLNEFLRFKPHGDDCVINAMELIKIINPKAAGIMRIIIEPEKGIDIPVIQNIFSFVYPGHIWQFKEYNKVDDFINRILTDFPINSVIFCGIRYNDDKRHAYLIGRDSTTYWIIDAHMGYCNLNEKHCYDYLRNGKNWYILEYMKN